MSQLVHRRIESLLAQRDPSHSPRRILVDCRGMPPRYNGSAQWILGFLRGLAELESGDAIDVLVYENVAEFHSLAQLYPQFRQSYREPEGPYFAAIGLTQPWELRTVAQLHRRALVNVFCMLDTIAWDILYPPGAIHLGAVWRFIGRHADGLMYISQFTKERFNARFDVSEEVAEDVTHLSFAREEYVDPLLQVDEESDYILVFGNEYDHKDVPATLRVLADAFPLDRVVAFGAALPAASNVTSVESGALEPAEMQRLVANARVIVYPSFYEGFGLPVVEGLAYGRPVVVRRSSLWREIAGCSRLPGTLVEFDDVPSLIEGVGRALAGLPLHGLPSGTQLANNTSPASWKDCVARALALLNTCGDRADGARWLEREQALRLAGL
ncbi:MAG: glycosyltransferase [Chloroflexi bacterium]|nr:glycosyltransferase [Chloroflexota bacterium]